MSTAGALAITTLELPLKDVPTLQITVTKDGATVYDLTNISAIEFRVFKNEDDADATALFTKTLADGSIVVTPPATGGQYQIALASGDVALLSPLNLYFFRSVVTPPDGRPGATVSGYLIVTP